MPPNKSLQEAAEWMACLQDQLASSKDEQEFKIWLASNECNRRAWDKVQGAWNGFDAVEEPGARQALDACHDLEKQDHQSVMRILPLILILFIFLPQLIFIDFAAMAPSYLLADIKTKRGEMREVTLEDGSLLSLNTATAVDVNFDEENRVIKLHRGELFIDVAADADRPLSIVTRDGYVQALGTQFSVRDHVSEQGVTEVAVYESIVKICPTDNRSCATLASGHQSYLSRSAVKLLPNKINATEPAWLNGRISILDRPIVEVLRELGRYHKGLILYDEESLLGVNVSGSFSLQDINTALMTMSQAADVNVTELSRWLVYVSAPNR